MLQKELEEDEDLMQEKEKDENNKIEEKEKSPGFYISANAVLIYKFLEKLLFRS